MTRGQALALLDTAPADGLRTTAALIREVAKAAAPGPWQVAPKAEDAIVVPDHEYETNLQRDRFAKWYGGRPVAESLSQADREHVLGWQPQVVLFVADLLDAHAELIGAELGGFGTDATREASVAVARAWLTGPSTSADTP